MCCGSTGRRGRMKRGRSRLSNRLTGRKSNLPQLLEATMYEVRSKGASVASNQQMTHVIAEAEQKIKEDAELWQDGKYIAQLTWMGSYFRVDYTGD